MESDNNYECTSRKKLSVAFARWNEQLFGPSPSSLTCTRLVNLEDVTLRPIKIGYFVKIILSYTIDNVPSSVFCYCIMVSTPSLSLCVWQTSPNLVSRAL